MGKRIAIVSALLIMAWYASARITPFLGFNTHIEVMGVKADLPGEHWYKLDTSSWGAYSTETWTTQDKKIIFRVTKDTTEDGSYNNYVERLGNAWGSVERLDTTAVVEYLDAFGYSGGIVSGAARLSDRKAVELEIYPIEPGEYHLFESSVLMKSRLYYVGAGTLDTEWDRGGHDTADHILDTVKFTAPEK